jgi:energy-coupling factor transport system substrate-specific component
VEGTDRTSVRIAGIGIFLGLAMVLVYWFATRGEGAWVEWSALTAVVLGVIGVAAGAAVGSSEALGSWTTWESVLAAVLAGVVGVLFWVWGLTVWKLLDVVKSAIPGYGRPIRDLFYGFWFLAAILVPYIVRRPGAAVAAEVVAAIISALLGAEWGLTVLISGIAQGGLAEVVFALRGYRHYDLATLIVASMAAGLGSWAVDYAFWYSTLQLHILLLMLVARFISAAVLSGLLARAVGDALAATGVLDNTALGRERALV